MAYTPNRKWREALRADPGLDPSFVDGWRCMGLWAVNLEWGGREVWVTVSEVDDDHLPTSFLEPAGPTSLMFHAGLGRLERGEDPSAFTAVSAHVLNNRLATLEVGRWEAEPYATLMGHLLDSFAYAEPLQHEAVRWLYHRAIHFTGDSRLTTVHRDPSKGLEVNSPWEATPIKIYPPDQEDPSAFFIYAWALNFSYGGIEMELNLEERVTKEVAPENRASVYCAIPLRSEGFFEYNNTAFFMDGEEIVDGVPPLLFLEWLAPDPLRAQLAWFEFEGEFHAFVEKQFLILLETSKEDQ